MENKYDLIIIGGGPAGLTAGIYGSRAGLKVMLLEKWLVGGMTANTNFVENYPGFPEGIEGMALMEQMKVQAQHFGTEIIQAEVKGILLAEKELSVQSEKQAYLGSAVIVATGSIAKKIKVPGEDELRGRGVSYCATCDGPLFKGRDVAVIGCGNSGLQEGHFLLKFANRVTFVELLPRVTGDQILQDRLRNEPRVQFLLNHQVKSINGKERVASITVLNRTNNEEKTVKVDGIFIYVGIIPNTYFLKDVVKLDELGFIITDEDLAASIPGIFAAGDVRVKKIRQIVTACADGAEAAISAHHYLTSL